MGRVACVLCAALALSGAGAAQVVPPPPEAAPPAEAALPPEASWLARVASGVRPMPMRAPTPRVVLRRIVLDLRGPEPPAPRFTPLLSEPPQVRRSRERRRAE